ncbi:hypothetical protein LTR94_029640, partial [Friedmanniomyces endolithicus]
CQRAAGKRAGRRRRATAVPPQRFALGQPDQPGHLAARDRRQCLQPRAVDPRRRAAGRSLRRLGALPRLCHRSYRPDPRHPRRGQRVFRAGRAGGDGGDRERRPRTATRARRRHRLWQPPLAVGGGIGATGARRRLRDAVGGLYARRRLRPHRGGKPRPGGPRRPVRAILRRRAHRRGADRHDRASGQPVRFHRHARPGHRLHPQPRRGRRRQPARGRARHLGMERARLSPGARLRLAIRRHRRRTDQ